jgi:hypothetical protein
MEALALDLNRLAYTDLSHFDRAALMSFLGQLEILDRASLELLRTMRVLAGMDTSRDFRVSSRVRDIFQPTRWDPGRLFNALYPPAVFVAAFLFWILMNPPTGPDVPMFAGILSIMILQTRMNPLASWFSMLLGLLFAVAPVYWLVMPALSNGFGLLSLIFVYSLFFGYFGGRSPALKSGPMIMFVVATGISNQQSYSFQGLVDAALMILLAGAILTAVYYLFNPMRPEQVLLRSLRRFFHGCARVTGGFALDGPSKRAKGRRIRKRYFESVVLPAPAKIQKAQKNLDYKLYPDNSPDKVQRLHDSLQSIAYRLESLELAHDRIARHSSELPEPFVRAGTQVRHTMQGIFERWARLEPGDVFEQQRVSLEHLSRELDQQFDDLESGRDRDLTSDQDLTSLYTMLGSVRGLIDAMANAQIVINQINWQQWATVRF